MIVPLKPYSKVRNFDYAGGLESSHQMGAPNPSDNRSQGMDDLRTAGICFAILAGLCGFWYFVATQGYIAISGLLLLIVPLLAFSVLFFLGRGVFNILKGK